MFVRPLLVVGVALTASHLARVGAFGSVFEDAFATWTNLCYVAAGLACTPALRTARRERARARPRGGFLLLLMGAASWAWHAEPSNGRHSPPHVLDIAFGWLLVTHLAYSGVVVAVDATFVGLGCAQRRWLRKGAQVALYIGLAVAVILIFTRYHDVYADQLALYLAAGPACAVTVAASRLLLTQQKGVTRRRGVLIAVFEAGVILGCTLAAVYAQTDLLGRKIDRSAARAAYDLHHGNWHFLMACVAVLVYTRLADVAVVLERQEAGWGDACVCALSLPDGAAMGTLSVYAALAVGLKEGEAAVEPAAGALFGVVGVGWALVIAWQLYTRFFMPPSTGRTTTATTTLTAAETQPLTIALASPTPVPSVVCLSDVYVR